MEPIKNDPYFAAYCKFTVAARFQKYGVGKNATITSKEHSDSMNFIEFKEALEKNEVVNKKNSRNQMSDFHKQNLELQTKYQPNPSLHQKMKEIMTKSFQLGLVGSNEMLIKSYEQFDL